MVDDDAKRIAGEYLSMFKDPEYANSPRADANEDDDANPELQNFEGLGSLFG